jgi:hypothetical protein
VKRPILALLAGLVVWLVAISVLNRGLRITLAGYAGAEPAMSFTLGMLWSRLLIGALSSLLAGAIAGWIAPRSPRVPVLLGILLLLALMPVHLRLWSLFPLWYHLVFLGTLVPLIVLGSRLARPRPMAEAPVRS